MLNAHLRKRDIEIIDFVVRYRLGTNATIHKVHFSEHSVNAVTKVTARLCSKGFLRRYPLLPPETYFTVGTEAVRQFGISPGRTEPLGPQSLPADYGVLIYSVHSNRPRRRLTLTELADYMPWLPDEYRRAPYCLTDDGHLEMIRVDLGGSPQHVARKVAADVASRLSVSELAQLAISGQFRLVVLTTTNEKSKLIASAIETQGLSQTVQVHMAVVRRLSYLQLRGH